MVPGTLFIVGAVIEAAGILVIAAPDLFPGARRFARWAHPRLRRVNNHIRRWLRLPLRPTVVEVGAAGAVASAGAATLKLIPGADAPLEAKVATLVQIADRMQDEVAELTRRTTALENETAQRLTELDREVTTRIGSALMTAAAEYRLLRIVGALAVTAGLTVATAGNFAT
jgi:hypothetical protein